MAATGNDVLAFFVMANSGNASNPSSVFAMFGEGTGSTRSNGHIEVNLRPRSFWDTLEHKPGPPCPQRLRR